MSNRTPGTSATCEFVYCKKPGAGELRAHYMSWREGDKKDIPWTMCAEHVKPERHPPDLHDKLIKW